MVVTDDDDQKTCFWQENNEEVAEAELEGDKAADKIQAQVEKEDDDFDPDNAEADEGEPIGADEADDAGEPSLFISSFPVKAFQVIVKKDTMQKDTLRGQKPDVAHQTAPASSFSIHPQPECFAFRQSV